MEEETQKAPQKLLISTVYDKDYKRIYSHGAIIHTRHDGEFSLEFYEDVSSLAQGFYFDDDNEFQVVEPNEDIKRIQKAGITFSSSSYLSLIEVMLQQYKQKNGKYPQFRDVRIEGHEE